MDKNWQAPYEQGDLEAAFLGAVEAMGQGDLESAETGFRTVLLGDPRLPEPRLELAVILYRRTELEEAEEQARLALDQLERGWHWLDNFEPSQLQSHGHNLLGEIILASAGGNEKESLPSADVLDERWAEAEACFKRAVGLDPSNREAARNLSGLRRQRRKR